MRKRITLDFETRSTANLKLVGAHKYSLDPSTRATCLAAKFNGQDAMMFLSYEAVNLPWKKVPEGFKYHWQKAIENGYLFCAHNAFFEQCIYYNILVAKLNWPYIPRDLWRCTAAKAAACALPRNLAGAGEALKLITQKDFRGYQAMMATCKPTRQWGDWQKARMQVAEGRKIAKRRYELAQRPEPPMFATPETHPDVFEVLYTYCKIDVKSEEELDEVLPDLIPDEQEIWFLNQKLNWRGLPADIPTIQKIVGIMARETKKNLAELDSVTMGLVTKAGARNSIIEFLALEGIELPNLRANTVSDFLKNGEIDGDMKRLLEIRQALSKTSTKKYQAFLERAGADGRVRDILLYHGASTGRDTGTGIQPHNFPRGLIPVDKARPYAAVENVIELDEEMLRILYGENLAILFSSILRNMLIPSEGKELFVADFSKIEVAVLWWLADNESGLNVLRSGKDPYKYQAAANLECHYDDIADESDDRQLAKAQILGCGFGMGWAKFQKTAWDQYRLKLTRKQSRAAVKAYRETHEAVPDVWKAYEAAAITAIEEQKTIEVGHCKFIYRIDRRRKVQFLWVELPSGRRLAYADPEIGWRVREFESTEVLYNGMWHELQELEETLESELDLDKFKTRIVIKHGRPQKTLEFWAVNSKTKKWSRERTFGGSLTENIVQAVARDLMMSAIVRLEHAGYQALLSVHDEAICEKQIGSGSLIEFNRIMTRDLPWSAGIPIEAKGWVGPRYRK